MLHSYFTSFHCKRESECVSRKYAHRPVWEAYDAPRDSGKRIMIFGEGKDERAGGSGSGIPAQMADDELESQGV